ncbi:MAG TPA: M28 family peptidase [Gemmatimonadaceae bacterium]
MFCFVDSRAVRTTLVCFAVAPLAASCATSSGSLSGRGAEDPAAFVTEGPLKFAPRPTSPAITAVDLMTRLYIFADDSMMGRDDGGPFGATKATNYIQRELRRLGLTPAGDNGGFFQDIGYRTAVADARSTITVDGQSLILGRDFAPVPRVGAHAVREQLSVIYGGPLDSIARLTAAQASGKLVMLLAPRAAQTGGRGGRGGAATPAALASAAAIVVVQGDSLIGASTPARGLASDDAARIAAGPLRINVTRAAAQRLLGADPAVASVGTEGKTARVDLLFAETRWPVRNVVAIVPGTDRALRNEYVAIGAHTDHIGFNTHPVDHDSLRAYNRVMRPRGANDPVGQPTAEQWSAIKQIRDSLSKLHPSRLDSIANGADDDGSGSVVLLEIAEALARTPAKRPFVLVWHAAEEDGLLGSRYFSEHPTVPRDSIVAQLNMDMLGRGRASDHAGGGPEYLRLIGSRRLSTELGDIVERVNTQNNYGFVFDYTFDVPGHPQNSYCRSDHYNYARFGIPIVYFSTGVQADYHMVTDEPQYIDYVHMARNASFIRDVALVVANLDHRPVVDKPKPDPNVPCRQ